MTAEIVTFARWLQGAQCLEVLLFWKEVEQFKTIFTGSERKKIADKIFKQYCEEGSRFQVNFRGDFVSKIGNALKDAKDADEELFDEAQKEVFELMRLDLYPRFNEELAKNMGDENENEEKAESLQMILTGTSPAAQRSFTRFVKEQLCEEALDFWLDTNEFALLFQQLDLDGKAETIYETYMGPSAKYKVNISDQTCRDVKKAIDEKGVENTLFLNAQKEVETFLELDVFPRYQDWMEEQKTAVGRPSASSVEASTPSGGATDRNQKRDAMKRLLDNPVDAQGIKDLATEGDAAENIEMYLAIQHYKLLFQAKDRNEDGQRIWMKFLDAACSRPANLPDTMVKQLQKKLAKGPPTGTEDLAPDLWAKAEKELLNLITDNFYQPYLDRRDGKGGGSTTAPAAPAPAPSSGGCCLVM